MFKNLVPQDQIFFDMFDQMAVNIVDGALLLKKMVDNSDNNSEYAQQIKTLEHQTDELVHKTLSHLHTTFVTPIEREDIHRLLVKLDDILDLTNKASAGIDMNKPKTFPREMADLVEVLVESVRIIQQMVALLRHLKARFAPKPERPVRSHDVPLSFHEYLYPTVSIPGIQACQFRHGLDQRAVTGFHARLILQSRARGG